MHYLNTIPWVQGYRREYSTRTREGAWPFLAVYRIAQRQLRKIRRAQKRRRGWG